MKQLKWRLFLIVALVMVAFVYVVPSICVNLPNWWKALGILPTEKIHLGLDLQGGMHLILEVQTQKAVENRIERTVQELRDAMKKAGIRYAELDSDKDQISVHILNKKFIEAFDNMLDKEFAWLRLVSRAPDGDGLIVRLDLPDQEVAYIKEMASKQAMETIRNRIDEFGVREPDIRRQGENRILIQLPGIKDPQRAVNLIGQTALLEFKLVDEEHDVQQALKGRIPPGDEIRYQVIEDKVTRRTTRTPFLLKKRTYLTGEYLTDARVQIDSQFGEPYVSMDFDKKGARLFERITEANVKKRLAIVLDGRVYSAPVIQEKISGGGARISGNFTTEDAKDLAIVLRAGALPAPVTILEERTVGPSLGRDSIEKGLRSMWVGGILVVLFIAIYYKKAGLIADIALFLDVLLIAATLAFFQATFTLPGIAGIILTIGMAVDANVIIFERIREEVRLGKTPRAAVDAGYSKATLTILDANVTTLIAALVLFQFGTGPVKGFAVTLSIGIMASLFTAIVVTRLFFDFLVFQRRITHLSI
ncbi:MAG: protein-export membrane protein SecD [Desulfobacterales bacterium S3730MH5]|nr:MAG: protein-export membrane protein SecD [Desulfobacterales bacterium S3730MH5]